MPERTREHLTAVRDGLLSEWRGVYEAVPTDREVAADDLHVPHWWRSRGQLAHALRSMKRLGLLTGGRGRFRRVDLSPTSTPSSDSGGES